MVPLKHPNESRQRISRLPSQVSSAREAPAVFLVEKFHRAVLRLVHVGNFLTQRRTVDHRDCRGSR